VRRRPCNYR